MEIVDVINIFGCFGKNNCGVIERVVNFVYRFLSLVNEVEGVVFLI